MRTSQLEYFTAVAETLSFTRASELCHVAQPAISQQIQSLEKELGFSLFVRSTKGVELIPPPRTPVPPGHLKRACRPAARRPTCRSHRPRAGRHLEYRRCQKRSSPLLNTAMSCAKRTAMRRLSKPAGCTWSTTKTPLSQLSSIS